MADGGFSGRRTELADRRSKSPGMDIDAVSLDDLTCSVERFIHSDLRDEVGKSQGVKHGFEEPIKSPEPVMDVAVHKRTRKKRFHEEDYYSKEGEYLFPISAVYKAPLLISGPSIRPVLGHLAFNPLPETLNCLFSSPSLPQPRLPLSNLSFPRFLLSSSLEPSTSSSIVSTFGPHYPDNDASTFVHSHLELLRCPGTNNIIAFFPTGENSDQVGFLILSVENSCLVVKADHNHDVFVGTCRLNHRILRISVNTVVDTNVDMPAWSGNSSATIGYLLASTMYSVHWYAIIVGDLGSDSAVPTLIHMGSKIFKSCCIVHACWSPYLREQSVVLLESGALFLFDLESCLGGNKCKGTKLKVSWSHYSNSGDFKWLACEFSWNFRTLIVARSDAVFVVDLQHEQCDVRCLMRIESLNIYTSTTENEQFRTLTKAAYDGFHFALVSDSLLVLCDVRRPSRPVLQWWIHGLQQPGYVGVFRLGDLRCNLKDGMYKKASESGFCIIVGSFWTSQFNLFCYGPLAAPSGTIASGQAEVCKSLYAWERPSSLLLSGRECFCGSCLVKEKFSKDELPAWIDWQHKKEIALGFSIIDKDISELLSEPDEFGGFALVRLMSSGKLESQRYSASWDPVEKIEESHEKFSEMEDYLMCYLLDEEYKFAKRYRYFELDYLKGYLDQNLDEVLVAKLDNSSMDYRAKGSFTPEYHEILCEKLNACGLGRARTSPVVSVVFKDISMPSSLHEVSLKRLWAELPTEFLQLAFSCYSEFLALVAGNKRLSLEFLPVPDQPQLPPFALRNPSWRSNKWSQKVPCIDDALVGPVLPLPILLALHGFHNVSPTIDGSGEFSVESELRLRRDEVTQVAHELAALNSTYELHNNQVVSLADDREETWANSEKATPFFLHQPVAFRGSTVDAETQHFYKDDPFNTFISKTQEKKHSSVTSMENAGLQLFDNLCPIVLKFDDSSAMNFSTKELKAYKLLKKQFSQWQGNFNLYEEFCSKRKLET